MSIIQLKILLFLLVIPLILNAQKLELLDEGGGQSLRGLSVVNDLLVWVSGNKGTVGKSLDGGKTWRWVTVPKYETRDFRDIEAFDKYTAVIMAAGEPALILKTTDGGYTWKTVYTNSTPGMFLDAMEFWNQQSGIVIGDPINGKFFIARTFDGGFNWRALTPENSPDADSGEACFAASGTNIRALNRSEACFVSGGKKSRLFYKDSIIDLPIIQGKETQGANSVAVWYKNTTVPKIAVAGGDFAADSSTIQNCYISIDLGKSWIHPSNPPKGYRSSIEFITSSKLVTCGINGVDISLDSGINWNSVSRIGFNVCRKSKNGRAVFLAGANGRIGKLMF